jgi:hypothetical protein
VGENTSRTVVVEWIAIDGGSMSSIKRDVKKESSREPSEMERPLYQRRSSCLPMQMFGVEIHSFLPDG